MQTFLAQAVAGLAMGSIYALVVTGTNLLLLVRNIMQFSYAHLMVLAMYAGWLILGATSSNVMLAIPAIVVACLVLVLLTEPVFRPLASRNAPLEAVVVGLGIGMILTDTMSHFINSGQPVAFPGNFAGLSTMVKFGTIAISLPQLLTIVVGVATVLGLQLFLYRQKQGRAFRAIAQSTDTARILGIPLTRAGIYSFALAGLIGGVAAVLTAATLGSAGPGLGDQLAIKATVIVLVAGGGNLWGGLGMAFGVGLADALTQAYLPGRWSDAIVFGVMMIGIIIRPNGVFGSRS